MTKRRLVLMRHAKSSWKSGASTDHARPLNKRGRRDAPRIAAALAERGWTPDLVVSSDAERTRETWALMAVPFGLEVAGPHVRYTDTFYHTGLPAIRADAESWLDDARTVLLIGHNPGWEDALEGLVGVAASLTTGNAALLEGKGDSWPEALAGGWKLRDLLRPKELP